MNSKNAGDYYSEQFSQSQISRNTLNERVDRFVVRDAGFLFHFVFPSLNREKEEELNRDANGGLGHKPLVFRQGKMVHADETGTLGLQVFLPN